jgi:hypothetical protein
MKLHVADNVKKLDDPDFRNAEKAMIRAALKAREKARRFGHGIVVERDGKIMEIPVEEM